MTYRSNIVKKNLAKQKFGKKKISVLKRKNQKNLKRKKMKQALRARPKLWSVPVPKHNLRAIGNKVRLYHFTKMFHLGSLMTHGLIFGDVIGNNDFDGVIGNKNLKRGYNAPNLTSENKCHNPSNIPKELMQDYVRLEVYFDENDRNIIPMGWFDRTYCGGINKMLIDSLNLQGKQNGDINTHYLYKGAINPSMIKKISVWNEETGYWDRLSKTKILEIINSQSQNTLTYKGVDFFTIDHLRIMGSTLNDWTGKVREFYAKTDDREVLQPLYELTDFINDNLKGRQLLDFQRYVEDCLHGKSINLDRMFQFIALTYNKISKEPVGKEWGDNLRERQMLWYERYGKETHTIHREVA